MITKKYLIILSVIVLSTCFFVNDDNANAQTRNGYPVGYEESEVDYFKRWTSQPWKGDDTPYERVRESVDKKLASTTNKDLVVDQYKMIAQSMPNDPIAQFRWGYAVFQTYKNESLRDSKFNEVIYPLSQMTTVSNYEFIRLRFLMEQAGSFANYLDDLAVRLLAKSPNDPDVLAASVRVLSSSKDIAKRRQAVAVAEQLYSKNPTDISVQRKLARVYHMSCVLNKNIEHGRKAIKYYERFSKQATDPDQIRYYNWMVEETKQRVEKLSKAKS